MQKERRFEIVWVNTDRPVGVSVTARPDQVITYNGKQQQIKSTL
jgi:hypothetical protein